MLNFVKIFLKISINVSVHKSQIFVQISCYFYHYSWCFQCDNSMTLGFWKWDYVMIWFLITLWLTSLIAFQISYVSAHDNETLFDVVSLKVWSTDPCTFLCTFNFSLIKLIYLQTPMGISVDERCRINHLATSIIALGQVLYTYKSKHSSEFDTLHISFSSFYMLSVMIFSLLGNTIFPLWWWDPALKVTWSWFVQLWWLAQQVHCYYRLKNNVVFTEMDLMFSCSIFFYLLNYYSFPDNYTMTELLLGLVIDHRHLKSYYLNMNRIQWRYLRFEFACQNLQDRLQLQF